MKDMSRVLVVDDKRAVNESLIGQILPRIRPDGP